MPLTQPSLSHFHPRVHPTESLSFSFTTIVFNIASCLTMTLCDACKDIVWAISTAKTHEHITERRTTLAASAAVCGLCAIIKQYLDEDPTVESLRNLFANPVTIRIWPYHEQVSGSIYDKRIITKIRLAGRQPEINRTSDLTSDFSAKTVQFAVWARDGRFDNTRQCSVTPVGMGEQCHLYLYLHRTNHCLSQMTVPLDVLASDRLRAMTQES